MAGMAGLKSCRAGNVELEVLKVESGAVISPDRM